MEHTTFRDFVNQIMVNINTGRIATPSDLADFVLTLDNLCDDERKKYIQSIKSIKQTSSEFGSGEALFSTKQSRRLIEVLRKARVDEVGEPTYTIYDTNEFNRREYKRQAMPIQTLNDEYRSFLSQPLYKVKGMAPPEHPFDVWLTLLGHVQKDISGSELTPYIVDYLEMSTSIVSEDPRYTDVTNEFRECLVIHGWQKNGGFYTNPDRPKLRDELLRIYNEYFV